jgi:hypothetical protein
MDENPWAPDPDEHPEDEAENYFDPRLTHEERLAEADKIIEGEEEK